MPKNSSLFILHSKRIFLRSIFLDHKVVDDEVLTLHGVFAHVVFEELLHLVVLVESDLFEAHVGTDESRKLLGRNLSKTFESSYLGVGT